MVVLPLPRNPARRITGIGFLAVPESFSGLTSVSAEFAWKIVLGFLTECLSVESCLRENDSGADNSEEDAASKGMEAGIKALRLPPAIYVRP